MEFIEAPKVWWARSAHPRASAGFDGVRTVRGETMPPSIG
jgi:hypothetical protein